MALHPPLMGSALRGAGTGPARLRGTPGLEAADELQESLFVTLNEV